MRNIRLAVGEVFSEDIDSTLAIFMFLEFKLLNA